MKKDDFTKIVNDAGDAIITYRSQNSRRLKYNVCTMDFDNKYIQSKKIEQDQIIVKYYYFVGTLILLDYYNQVM